MEPRKTRRLDAELALRGLAASRTRAARLVVDGKVSVDGRAATRTSQPVHAGSVIEVDDVSEQFASRAAHKLVAALDGFGVDPRGKACLDAGASTGGFTEVLLSRGARAVHAVDVGHGQLAGHLRSDPRVLVREGLNIRDLVPRDLGGPVDLVVGDLSFISLTLVLGPLSAVARPGASLLLLVKPQFEVGKSRLGKNGIVTDPALREEAVRRVSEAGRALGLRERGRMPSPLPGTNGNVEHFLWLENVLSDPPPKIEP